MIKYRPKHFELPALSEATWDYMEKWHLIPIYEYALETKDKSYDYDDERLAIAVNGEAFGLYNAILVHMGNNEAFDERNDFYGNCKRIFAW